MGVFVLEFPTALVDMAKDVELGLDDVNPIPQGLASHMNIAPRPVVSVSPHLVQDACWRAMSDKDIGICWDLIPDIFHGFSWKHKGPTAKLW